MTAYQTGNGLVNLVTPTSAVVMGGLAIARVGYGTWLKFVWPVLIMLAVLSMVVMSVAVLLEMTAAESKEVTDMTQRCSADRRQCTDRAWHGMTPEEALARAGRRSRRRAGRRRGGVEARRRTGRTSSPRPSQEPRWRAFLRQYRDPMQIVLLIAGGISLFLPGQFATGVVLIGLTLLNAFLGLNQEGKAEASVAALQKMMVVKAKVRRGGEVDQVAMEELVPGDIVNVEAGDLVPADGRILRGGHARDRRVRADRRERAGAQERRAGRRRRRPRRPRRHGVHEHAGHPRRRRRSSSRRPAWRPKSATSPTCSRPDDRSRRR